MAKLDFVKSVNDAINYREQQKELIKKASEISNGDKLMALNYIVSCLFHEGVSAEFELVFTIPANEKIIINLPIVESQPPDELGYYVSWGGILTHNVKSYEFKKINEEKEYCVRFFGMGIISFGHANILDSLHENHKNYGSCLTKVVSFGVLGHFFTSLKHAFSGCTKNKVVPKNLPSSITDTSYMFWCCNNFNQVLQWDTSNVTNMNSMFLGCENFDQALQWNTSSVTNMSCVFLGCKNFNQALQWDTSNVINMSHMFRKCENFNQALQWDTSSVTNMAYMFMGCENFNQVLQWDTSNVTEMSCTFSDCKNFNQVLQWDTSNVTNASRIFWDDLLFKCQKN